MNPHIEISGQVKEELWLLIYLPGNCLNSFLIWDLEAQSQNYNVKGIWV